MAGQSRLLLRGDTQAVGKGQPWRRRRCGRRRRLQAHPVNDADDFMTCCRQGCAGSQRQESDRQRTLHAGAHKPADQDGLTHGCSASLL